MPAELPPLALNAWLRWDVVARQLPPADPTLRVLEIGCGQGGFGARLAQRYDYTGVDADATAAEVAAARVARAGGRGRVLTGDLATVVPDGEYDLVCAFEVIEHIEDDDAALADWARRVRPGGTLLLSTPAWARRMGPWDEIVGHYRRYDPPVLRDKLARAGLTDVELVHFGAPLGYALETARNVMGRRRAAALAGVPMQDRTESSSRQLQPTRPWLGLAMRAASLPFRKVQHALPNTGLGLVAKARRP